jgi:hypothetical protein
MTVMAWFVSMLMEGKTPRNANGKDFSKRDLVEGFFFYGGVSLLTLLVFTSSLDPLTECRSRDE